MDLDHLYRLVVASRDEAEKLNTDGPAYAELIEYIGQFVSPQLELLAFKAFVYGVGRGISTSLDARNLPDVEFARQLREAFEEWRAKQ